MRARQVLRGRDEHVKALLPLYLEGEVTEWERAVVEGHLPSCQECKDALLGLRRLERELAALEMAPEMVEVMPEIVSRVFQGMAERRAGAASFGGAQRALPWAMAMAAFFALVVALALALNARQPFYVIQPSPTVTPAPTTTAVPAPIATVLPGVTPVSPTPVPEVVIPIAGDLVAVLPEVFNWPEAKPRPAVVSLSGSDEYAGQEVVSDYRKDYLEEPEDHIRRYLGQVVVVWERAMQRHGWDIVYASNRQSPVSRVWRVAVGKGSTFAVLTIWQGASSQEAGVNPELGYRASLAWADRAGFRAVRGTVFDNAASAQLLTLVAEGEEWSVPWNPKAPVHFADGRPTNFRDLKRGAVVRVVGSLRSGAQTQRVVDADEVVVLGQEVTPTPGGIGGRPTEIEAEGGRPNTVAASQISGMAVRLELNG